MREQVLRHANRLIRNEIGHLTFWPASDGRTGVVARRRSAVSRASRGTACRRIRVDQLVANVGYRPNYQLYDELQVAVDPATDAPTRWPVAANALSTRRETQTALPMHNRCGPASRLSSVWAPRARPRFAIHHRPRPATDFANYSPSLGGSRGPPTSINARVGTNELSCQSDPHNPAPAATGDDAKAISSATMWPSTTIDIDADPQLAARTANAFPWS